MEIVLQENILIIYYIYRIIGGQMGKKANYYEVISVASANFPATPQASFGFHSTQIVLLNIGTDLIEYSFDGVNVHGDLNPTDPSRGVLFSNRSECKVFFRAINPPQSVRVEAWSY